MNYIKVIILLLCFTLSSYADNAKQTYADHSVLATGKWAKIRVSDTGIGRLTQDVIQSAGFTNLSRIKVYGYGGAIIPERLTQDWLAEHDDLKEIPTYYSGDAKYFNATGTVTWSSNTALKRERNPYASYGYYFITESNGDPLSITEAELLQEYNSSADRYHFLYEVEAFSYGLIGRSLIDKTEIRPGQNLVINVTIPGNNTSVDVQSCIASGSPASYTVEFGNIKVPGSMSFGNYDRQKFDTKSKTISGLEQYLSSDGTIHLPVTVTNTGKEPIRIDYISASFEKPYIATAISNVSSCKAEYVETVANQDHHADAPTDLVIIIPTSGELYAAANKLAEHHRNVDGMTVRIIKANELYNEFSSGTPEISAYRRYLKMFYDKAGEDETKKIKNVLLFGDALWDNRIIHLSPTAYSADRYLLGYQTENSQSLLSSIICDDYITVLRDNMTIHIDNSDAKLRFDVGVGRIPVTTAADANNVVDKIIRYVTNSTVGSWQNEIMFIGDDGFYKSESDKDNDNSHMRNINTNADYVIKDNPGYHVKKVMLDSYELKSTSLGERYPEISTLLQKQQKEGALIMNYCGHASWVELSNRQVLSLNDFTKFKGDNYSLWFTAGCETVPFDQTYNTIGEAALLNKDGGAVAFYGTVRTVTESSNSKINIAFTKHVLDYDANGKPLTLGEVQRRAKNDLIIGGTKAGTDYTINKHHYVLIGDPAMSLAIPRHKVIFDEINGKPFTTAEVVKGNSIVTVRGHIEDNNGNALNTFKGKADILIRDSKKTITCRGNTEPNDLFTYEDRTSTLFKGSCIVNDGEFFFTFRMPRDIYNDGGNGLITMFAVDDNTKVSANGECEGITAQGWEDIVNDEMGPSIYCYLNDKSFRDGGDVNKTPYFVAEIFDKDGVNASGSSLGHHMELVIDNDATKTYDITKNFVFDYNSYTSGQTYFTIEELTPGIHSLQFKAWDLLNNSNSVTLNFNVVKNIKPALTDVFVSPNPVRESATFYVTHDMRGSEATVCIDIISPSGKITEVLQWNDIFSEKSNTTTYRWTPTGIAPGLYLYRVRISCNGSEYVTKSKKLIIAQ